MNLKGSKSLSRFSTSTKSIVWVKQAGAISENRGRPKCRGGKRKGEQTWHIDSSDDEMNTAKPIHAFSVAVNMLKNSDLK